MTLFGGILALNLGPMSSGWGLRGWNLLYNTECNEAFNILSLTLVIRNLISDFYQIDRIYDCKHINTFLFFISKI